MLNLPNILTITRILLIPVLIGLFFMETTWGAQAAWLALDFYVIAALTDYLDGFLARKYKKITPLGTFLDPISDKIFVSSMLILLVASGRLPGLWIIAVIIVFAREFLVSGLREFLGPHKVKLPVTMLAKWKTFLQMLSISVLIIGPYISYGLLAGQVLFGLAAFVTVVTGWGYLKTGLDYMKKMP